MMTEEQLEKYREIYKKKFGKEISKQEALEQGTALLRLVELIYVPMTEKEYKQLQERRKQTGDIIQVDKTEKKR